MKEEKSTLDIILLIIYIVGGVLILFLILNWLSGKFNSSYKKNVVSDVSDSINVIDNRTVTTTKTSVVKNKKIEVLDVFLDREHLTLKLDDSYSFGYAIIPSNSTDKNVSWSTSDEKIVSIDGKGNIKAVGIGSAVITIKTSNGLTSSCVVAVKDNKVSEINIKKVADVLVKEVHFNKNSESMYVGNSLQLNVSINPSNATNKNIRWGSSNQEIATVNNNGLVIAKKEGNVIISAYSENGIYDTCNIKVSIPYIEVNGVVFNKSSETLNLGQSLLVSANVLPNNATDKSISLISSNEGIAKIVDGRVYGVGIGETTIIAKSKNGKTASMNIKVVSTEIPVSSLIISDTFMNVNSNEKIQLKLTINPIDASNKKITWKSSNNNIATVDSNGVVTGIKSGTVTIMAIASNGISTYSIVTVNGTAPHAFGIKLNKSSETVDINKKIQLSATLTPNKVVNSKITWKSSNNDIATVDSNGIVTGKKAGTVTISASTVLGITDKCYVTVK